MLHWLLGVGIFIATMAGILVRPWGLSEALAALIGAAAMVAAGFLPTAGILPVLIGQWNIYGFFLGLMTITAFAERAGIFESVAAWTARAARGSSRRLFLGVFLGGALITAFFSNDATALILTPAVYAMTTRLRLSVLPFLYACTFVADGASFLLPVSNPVNLLFVDAFHLSLGGFVGHLLAPSLASILFTLAPLLFLFRAQLRASYELSSLPPFVPANRGFYRYTAAALPVVGAGYLVCSLFAAPLSIVALAGGAALALGAAAFGEFRLSILARGVSWTLFPFITGLFIVIQAVEALGITGAMGRGLLLAAGSAALPALLLAAGGSALGANLVNNVPMALVMVSMLGGLGAAGAAGTHGPLLYASIVGVDLGPNLTTLGSLATMIWMFILRKRGVEVSSLGYFKVGIRVVPPILAAAALLLWLGV